MKPPRFTGAWWGRESAPLDEPAHLDAPDLEGVQKPILVRSDRALTGAVIKQRANGFTSEWRPGARGDAATALVQLFGEQAQPVLERVNLLPDKYLAELLRTAGVVPVPATPAKAMLEFTVSPAATQSVLVPAGYQVGAQPAGGGGDLVVFETDESLWATPCTISERQLQEGTRFRQLASDGPFQPFGPEAKVGSALFLGLDGTSAPAPTLTLFFQPTAPVGAPPPVPAGGVAPLPSGPVPFLVWEVLDLNQFVRGEVLEDQTGGLQRSGTVTLRTPPSWRPARPLNMPGTAQLRWLRVRVAAGAFPSVPSLDILKLNMASATAARTIRDEVLQAEPDSNGRRFLLSQVPVLPGSVTVEVDEGDVGGAVTTWTEVDDLRQWGSEARVFELDGGSGELRFGDGTHGAEVPLGFRNVAAKRYQAGGGTSGAVDAGQITTLLQAEAFVTQASNPLPATGGTPEEPRPEVLLRGPQEIRARNRAVTLADYELLALRSPGAQVARAHAVSGLHPGLPGRPIPGVVGLLVVPMARGAGPYIPDEGTLRSVASYLSSDAAPAGVAVVAGAPRYHMVRVEAQVVLPPGADEGAAVGAIIADLDQYFDPLEGGDDGQGWPFGGTLRYAALVRRMLAVTIDGAAAVLAVPLLALVVDGLRVPLCQDRPIPANDLIWPTTHQIIPVPGGGS